MRLQACGDNRSTRDARPYPYACVDTAQTCRSRFHGISQREEYTHDIRATCKPKIQIRKESVLGERIVCKYSRWKRSQDPQIHPFKNVADFDDDDSPEVPADSMRKQKRRQCAVDVAHCAPLGAAGIMAPMGPFCKPRVFTRGYDYVGKRLHTFCTPFAHLPESGAFLRMACTACFPLHKKKRS